MLMSGVLFIWWDGSLIFICSGLNTAFFLLHAKEQVLHANELVSAVSCLRLCLPVSVSRPCRLQTHGCVMERHVREHGW